MFACEYKKLSLTGLMASFIGLIFSVLSAAVSAQVANGTYTIQSKFSGLVLDVANASTADGANVQQWAASGGSHQQWQVSSLGDGYYTIIASHSGMAMEVYNFDTADGANISQWTYWGGEAQQWSITNQGSGYYSILNRYTGKSLDVYGWSTASGGNIAQWTYAGGDNQLWALLPVNSDNNGGGSSNTATLEENQTGFCGVDGAVESEYAGFTGAGYANTTNATGATVSWAVNAGAAGTATLQLRFANGGSAARPGNLSVNGGNTTTVQFAATGGWASWQTASVTVNLSAGQNTLALVASGAEGLPNIDSLTVTGSGIAAAQCSTSSSSSSSSSSSTTSSSGGQVLAFPGAQGFGRYATGGRYGEVYHVTNLNDSGTGSLRDAISQPNRIVVFDVGGVIQLNSRLVFKNNQTIAGQTAPGGGITIYGQGTSFSAASNTIVRYIRFRMGQIGTSGQDTVTMANGHDVIWDHCSLSWGRDANFDLNRSSGAELYNLTLQDSIVAQGLQTHSTGGISNTSGTSIIRSLYIDNNSRNPKAIATLQFVNNVIYNWVVSGFILGDTTGRSDGAMVGNYLIAGPETNGGTLSSPTPQYNIYAVGNYYDSNKDGTLNGRLLAQGDFGTATWWTTPSVNFPDVPAMSAQNALNHVINNAGASKWRDAADTYVINELLSYGTRGATISNETSLGLPNVVGNIPGGSVPADTDRDGMADAWENSMGLNPNNAGDANGDIDGDGWTNVEEYINSLAP